MTTSSQSAPRVPRWWNYWGWGSGDVLGAGAQAVITGWLFYFFTTFCGLTAVEAGLILGLPRLLEAITCPLIGYLSDNLRHTRIGRRIGRRKVFLLITIPLLPSFALIFVTGQTFLYYLAVFVFFELLYTMFLIPWETLAAEMTKDYKQKARFAGARILVGQGSAIVASYLPTVIINAVGGRDSAQTFFIMGGIFGVMFSLTVLVVVCLSWERPYTAEERAVRSAPFSLKAALLIPARMFRDLFSTLRIRAFRQHLSIYLGGYISQDIFNTAFPIFVATVMMGATVMISQMMTLMYAAQLVSVMVAINLVIRIGPAAAYRIAIAFFGAALLWLLAIYLTRPAAGGSAAFVATDPASVVWVMGPIILAGLGRGTLNFVPWSVYNYLPDVDEAVTGQRREGIFAGVMTLVRKVAQSGAIIITGWIIDLGGYVSPKTAGGALVQSPQAVATVAWLLVLGPAVVMLLGLAASWRFRLNARTHEVLMAEIEHLRVGATAPSSRAAGEVVEDLTGWPYARLWGRNTLGARPLHGEPR
ncbi:MFS transporter [Caulobacter segnis]|uniref:MFS transporter n=1 Tax=Caulobacter segnis TaxID=88688 RepID=UPI002410623F|nr:MFS transporter [Caulobacter segnis]MDG2520340.1 MFS transporter [Caulobacter segnis]